MTTGTSKFSGDKFDLKEVLRSYTKHWKWFLVSAAICVGLAYVTLRYDVPHYLAQASIKIIDSESSIVIIAHVGNIGQFIFVG